MDIIKKYNINFFKKNIHGHLYYGMTSVNRFLNQLITDDQHEQDVNETIDAITLLLNGEINSVEYSGESLTTIIADSSNARIYDVPNFTTSSEKFTLPTADFFEVIKLWKKYLTSACEGKN